MTELLNHLLNDIELSARIIQSGQLNHSAIYDAKSGFSFIHVLKRGSIRFHSPKHKTIHLSQPTLTLYIRPLTHSLIPVSGSAELQCASFKIINTQHPMIQLLPDVVCIELDDLNQLSPTLSLIETESKNTGFGDTFICDRIIEILIVKTLRLLIEQGTISTLALAGFSHPKLAKALLAIHQNYRRSWTLEKLANLAGMSRASFCKCFHDVLGDTPNTYLAKIRLSQAKNLLKQGISLELVAEKTGYATASSLSRSFKKHYQHTPSQWIKESRTSA